jgi:hypothetical protein
VAALTCLAGAAAWLFRLHLTGSAQFIGNSDRLNNMLNVLTFYTDNFRRGKVVAWDEAQCMGFNALALPYTFPHPLALLETLAGRQHLFFIAGVGSCLLLAAAGWAAYAFIRDLSGHRFASFIGAVLYMFTALTTLKVSQNDMSFAVLIVIPVLMLLLRRTRPGSEFPCFLGLALLFACLFTFMFLQKAAYALMLGGGYALCLSLSRRDWRPVGVAGAAFLVGLSAGFPRVYTVGEDMLLSHRGTAMSSVAAAEYYRRVADEHEIPAHVALRWLDDGLFGRFPAEARAAGNRLNLNEGMLLYSSAFAVFLLAAGAVRFRGGWLRLLLFREPELSYLFYFLLFAVLVLTWPSVLYFVYRLFLRWDFIHARILVAAVLPASALAAVVLRDFLGEFPAAVSRRRAGVLLAAALILAAAVVVAAEALARAGAATRIDVSGVFRDTRVLAGPLLRLGFSLAVFLALCLVRLLARNRPVVRWATGAALGLLLVLSAAAGADFRLNGGQNRPTANPYGGDNFLLADPGAFALPSAEARELFARRLEADRYRSIVVGDRAHFPPVCASHLSQFWNLRLVDCYISGVDRALSVLPWGNHQIGERTIVFHANDALPWHILALLNVKYAVVVNRAFYQNGVPLPGGGYREARPGDVTVLENPLRPIMPRHFFAANVEPADSPEAAVKQVFGGVPFANVSQTSYAEGLTGPGHFSTAAGHVSVYGTGDRLDIRLEPADEPRFLVLNERFHPRWRAWAGAQELRIYRTNVVMRGLVVPPGVSHITMQFVPFVFSARALPFYGGALFLLAAGGWVFRRLARASAAAPATSPGGAGSGPAPGLAA